MDFNNINPNLQTSGQEAGANNQVLTLTEFYDAKTKLQNKIDEGRHETEDLRHDMDSKLALMTSQLQQMFSAFQQKLTKDLGQYETNKSQDFEGKYIELVRNHTQLQQNFDTQVLSINDRARSEDFRALYNMTVNSVSQISRGLNEQNRSTEARFQNTDARHNASLVTLLKEVHDSEIRQNVNVISKVNSLENNFTLTIGNVQQAVSKINNRAWIDSNTNYAAFHIYKNEMSIVGTVFNYISTTAAVETTGTAVAAVELQIGDTVKIKADKYQNQMIELLFAKNKTEHLSDRVNDLSQCKNKTMELEKAVDQLKVSKSIQPLCDFSALQQQVQTINSQTQGLSTNDRARSKNFRALYNMTINSMSQMSRRLNEQNVSTEACLQNTDVRQNGSIVTLIKEIHDFEER
ncbi:unnamed protein product [Mytilus coruscus]|uniref:Uncharacterized protein n=1 Tax=Mytilus coruscus TaxID=42192 RepID=A0A6J8ASR5_MYTCO|nr:unnamed protein product [Mytilus coruscus]